MMTEGTPVTGSKLSRRALLRGAAGTAVAAPLMAALQSCGGGSDDTGDSVVYVAYGGTPQKQMNKAQLDPFTKATGIKVTNGTEAGDYAKLHDMVTAERTTWDVVNATTLTFGQAVHDGLLTKMDWDIVSKGGYIDPNLVFPYGVPQYSYAHCIFWNSDAIKSPLETWADVWNVDAYPGKRAFQKNADYLFEEALMADGVAPKDLYPLDIPRVMRKLDEIEPHAEFQDLNTIQNLVAQGEIVAGDLNLSRVKTLIDDGVPLKYTWNQNILDHIWWVIPKGAPDPTNAQKLIAFSQDPKRQVDVLRSMNFTPSLVEALDIMTPEERADSPGTPETSKTAATLSMEYYSEHSQEVTRAMNDWLLGS